MNSWHKNNHINDKKFSQERHPAKQENELLIICCNKVLEVIAGIKPQVIV